MRALLCALCAVAASSDAALPHDDDPEIVSRIEALGDNSALRFGEFGLAGDGLDAISFYREHGPRVRDYSTKMAYAPDRETALYCGASHNTPVVNDVWEYHLGSNTWHVLYPSDGRQDEVRGNWRRMRGAESKIRRGLQLGEEERNAYDEASAEMRAWYRDHASFSGGYLHTRNGGPLYPSHTWDGLTYDPLVRRMLWHPAGDGNLVWYARFMDLNFDRLERERKPTTKVWMYEPAGGKWSKQIVVAQGPHPPLRGMGATLQYIPDLRKSIFYVAVDNVSPAAREMWSYDAVANRWEELRPNGGRTIGELVKDGIAPQGEVQVAYSTRDKKLVALAKSKTWVYDITTSEWSFAVEDTQTLGFHARSVFVYDQAADVFLLVQPGPETEDRKRTPYIVREFRLDDNKWRTITPVGPLPRKGTWWPPAGYYDPLHNVTVTYNTDEMWIYRHTRRRR